MFSINDKVIVCGCSSTLYGKKGRIKSIKGTTATVTIASKVAGNTDFTFHVGDLKHESKN